MQPLGPPLLHALVARVAAEKPDATAVIAPDGELSYGELWSAAVALAGRLRGRSVAGGELVGLCAGRSRALIVGLLGILEGGGAYVPLDPDYPSERLDQLISEASPRMIVTDSAASRSTALAGHETIPVEIGSEAESAPADPSARVKPEDAAYVIFTSGSTGRPKGVVVEHRNATWSTLARHEVYEQWRPRSFLLLSSVAFDSSVAGIFWTLSCGGTLVIPSPEDMAQPDRIASLASRTGVTHLLTVPTLYAELVRHLRHDELELVVVAGEECPPPLVERHREALPDVEMFNEYGPTEAAVWATTARLDPGRPVTLGREVPGARVLILDEGGKAVPPGEAGEIWIGGPGVARGYLDRPELTAERFRPEAPEATARIYRTGDLGRRLQDGEIEFLGRADRQVQIAGVRVELGEIEAVLREHPRISSAAAVLAPSRWPGALRPIAGYLTAVPDGPPPDLPELDTYIRSRLPAHMVPATLKTLKRLPTLPNGKVDHPALEALSSPVAPGPSVELQGMEGLVAELYRDLLELTPDDPIAPSDNFFALGGHSLMLMRLRHRIAEETGNELPVRKMMAAPTVAGLARLLGESGVEREARLDR